MWESNGQITDLGLGSQSTAFAISSTLGGTDWIVGERLIAGRAQATLWRDGQSVDLGGVVDEFSTAYDVNIVGQIVGVRTSLFGLRGFIWENGTRTDLTGRLVDSPGWDVTAARAIDNWGYIVGTGLLDGQQRSCLLTPIFEQQGPPPTIGSLSPATGRVGQELAVTVRGANFRQGARASLGDGIEVRSASVSGADIGPRLQHLLTLQIAIAANAVPGPRTLTVTNPDNQQAVRENAFTVQPADNRPQLAAFTLEPNPVVGGSKVSGSVTLSAPATGRGARVTFKSSDRRLRAPAPVTVKKGHTTLARSFKLKTRVVTEPVTITVTASYGGASRTVDLTLLPRH